MTFDISGPAGGIRAALLAFLLASGCGMATASQPKTAEGLPDQSRSQEDRRPIPRHQTADLTEQDNSHTGSTLIGGGLLLALALGLLSQAARRARTNSVPSVGPSPSRHTGEKGKPEREPPFQSFIEQATDPIFRYDRDCRRIYANPAAGRLAGKPIEELIGNTPADQTLLDTEQGLRLMQAIRDVFANGEKRQLQVQLVASTGKLRTPNALLVPEYDDNGEVESVLAMSSDRMESSLIETPHARYFDVAPGLFYTLIHTRDSDYRMSFANAGVYDLYGLEPEVVKKDFSTLLALVHPDDMEMRRCKLEESERNLTPFRIDYRILHPNKGLLWVEVHALPQRQADGSTRWDGFVHDITERKRLESELRLKEYVLDHARIGVYLIDENARITYVNEEACRALGYSQQELLTKTSMDIDVNHSLEASLAVRQRTLIDGAFTFETRHVRSDGSLLPVEIWASLQEYQGKTMGVALAVDITERQRVEQQLGESEARHRHQSTLLNAVLESSSDVIIFALDRDYRYTAFNRIHKTVMQNIWGKEILPGMNMLEVIGSCDDANAAKRSFDRVLAGESFVVEEAYGDESLSRQIWQSHYAPIRSDDGEIVGLTCFVLNVTERKQAEDYEKFRTRSLELMSSSASLRTVLEGIVLGIEQLNPSVLCSILLLDSQGQRLVDGVAPSMPDFYCAAIDHTPVGRGIGSCGEAAFTGCRVIAEDLQTHPNWAKIRELASRAGLGACWSEPIRSTSNQVLGTFAIYHRVPYSPTEFDLSLIEKTAHLTSIAIERKRAEVELQRRELEFRSLVENTPDTIARYDRECRRWFANDAFCALVEGGIAALLGKTPTECPGGENAKYYEEMIRGVFASGQNAEFELQWKSRNGNEFCSHVRLTPERDASGKINSVLAVGHDITELNQSRQKIHQMAFYDTLTKLPNRALFNDRLHQMLIEAARHDQQAGVMLLDLDRFKFVNDTLGHPAGDQLLREAGARLSSCLRDYDTVARLGGDEFAILLPEIRSGDDMGKIARNILDVFKTPFLLDDKEAFISTSIGIAAYPGDSLDADELIKQADSAMYSAKRSGRNAFCFYSKDLTDSANERLTLEADLRHGFERGELELYYQPKVCLVSGVLLGSEALLRWRHPARGMVAPDQFIPIAEDSGQIIEIGAWVLRNACRTASDWNGPGKPLHKVAINLSARQFQIGNLLQTVRDALHETDCQTDWIELEITESMLLDEDGRVLEILETLQTMGVTIAIDDFGTGYSSLSYLARFPINTLKIDRSFTSHIADSEYHAELIKAMISIAHNLKQNVVAEGVETEEQEAFLREYGCHVGQGYLYGKPVPKSAFESLFYRQPA